MAQLRTNGRRVLEAHLQGSAIRAVSGSMVAAVDGTGGRMFGR